MNPIESLLALLASSGVVTVELLARPGAVL